ncbi:MAG TPA: homoserine dehydrogenase [Alphaproteobacteria bacterium]|nr:homoserine dehydrogenase [Alphaproteobacteria bacterium]
MASPLKIAIAGLGTVGAGVVKLLADNGELLAQRCGRPLVVTAVSARDKGRKRGVDLGRAKWFDDAAALAAEADAEIVLELIGGSDGIARRVCEIAIARGRSVVTANKALLAVHGTALARAAEEKDVSLCYEAAVAGGIPVIKALREGLAANRILRIYGILNGTCNYILTQMRRTGRPFAEVLAEAQKLGYAEADPSFDVDGIDAAHKLAILAGLAFGAAVNFAGVHIEGIRHIAPLDLEFAKELGYRLKLLGIARMTDHGIEQRVHPCLVPIETPIAAVEDVFNAVVAEGNFAGRTVFEGRGAGAGPTASAVVADVVDLARGRRTPTFGVPVSALALPPVSPMERRIGAYYIRLMVVDRPGVIADVTAALRDENVSLESMLQRGRSPDEMVPVVLTTHDTEEAGMNRALRRIQALNAVLEPPRAIRIENL